MCWTSFFEDSNLVDSNLDVWQATLCSNDTTISKSLGRTGSVCQNISDKHFWDSSHVTMTLATETQCFRMTFRLKLTHQVSRFFFPSLLLSALSAVQAPPDIVYFCPSPWAPHKIRTTGMFCNKLRYVYRWNDQMLKLTFPECQFRSLVLPHAEACRWVKKHKCACMLRGFKHLVLITRRLSSRNQHDADDITLVHTA